MNVNTINKESRRRTGSDDRFVRYLTPVQYARSLEMRERLLRQRGFYLLKPE